MTTYLVTGGAGFIGSNFVRFMLGHRGDVRIVGLDALTYAGNPENLEGLGDDGRHVFVRGDVRDPGTVAGLIRTYDPDVIVNFAAETHVDRSITGPEVFASTNVAGTVNLLQRAKEAWYDDCGKAWKKGKKFIQISTDEVYGALGAEGYFTEDSPLDPHSPYSASKASADLFVQAYRDTYGMPVNVTRCSNNYGPYQFPEKLIPLMIMNAKAHRPLPVYGDGLQVRDWLYVEDHCRAVELVASAGRPGEVYNIGGHNERTNLSVVETVVALLSERLRDPEICEGLIRHVADRPGHDRRYGIDPEKIRKDLGWRPETDFEDGLAKTVDWYLAHEGWTERVTSGEYMKYYEETYGDR